MLNYPTKIKKMLLKEVATFKYGIGNTIPNDGGRYPVYGCNGIVGYTSKYNNEDTPIIGHIGSAGVVVWATGKHYVTYNGTICKANENIVDKHYLYYQLLFLKLENYLKGGQPFLSVSDFNKLSIYIPPLKEQKAIADTLSVFDIHIENLTRLIEKKKAIRDGALEDLVNGKIRLDRFNDAWKYCKIHELFNVTAGGDLNKKYFSKMATSKHLYEVFSNGIDNRGIYGYTSLALYKGNSLTITARGTIGCAYYREKHFDAIIRLLVLIPKNDEVNPKFYEYYINNKVEFEPENTGVPQLTVPKVKEKNIPFMERKEQEAIIEVLIAMDDEIVLLKKELDKIKQIKEGTMEDLLTGRVRLKV